MHDSALNSSILRSFASLKKWRWFRCFRYACTPEHATLVQRSLLSSKPGAGDTRRQWYRSRQPNADRAWEFRMRLLGGSSRYSSLLYLRAIRRLMYFRMSLFVKFTGEHRVKLCFSEFRVKLLFHWTYASSKIIIVLSRVSTNDRSGDHAARLHSEVICITCHFLVVNSLWTGK